MSKPTFDMQVLRTLVILDEVGSLSQAGEIVGRSQSALSLQLKKLEDQAGLQLLKKSGRLLEFTDAGETLLSYARRIIALNDEAARAVSRNAAAGHIRFGMQQDFSETWLPRLLKDFRVANPKVRMEVEIGSGMEMVTGVQNGKLDIALALGLSAHSKSQLITHMPLIWIASETYSPMPGEPLDLVTFGQSCRFRRMAIEALDAASLPWRIAVTSESLGGVMGAVKAGLGITPRTVDCLAPGLMEGAAALGLPEIGVVDVSIYTGRGEGDPAITQFGGLVRKSMARHLGDVTARGQAA